MNIFDFVMMYFKGKELERKEQWHREYCALLPWMEKKMSFDEYVKAITGNNYDKRSSEEIIEHLEKLHGRRL